MKQLELIQDQRGSSVLLILVITGVAMFLVMTSIQSQADHSYRLLKMGRLIKQDAKFLQVTLNMVMNSPVGCARNFANKKISPGKGFSINQIYYGDGIVGTALVDLSNPIKSRFGKKKITKMALEPHATKFGTGAAGPHLAHLVMEFDDFRKLTMPIWVTTENSGKITQCHSTTYMDVDDLGEPRTLEEKYCTSSSTKNQTSNWKPVDCMDCLTRSDPFYLCVECKKKGLNLDSATLLCK